MKTPVTRNGMKFGDAAPGVQQQAEDQVVDRRVQQRRHDLPELAELGLAVLRGQPGGGERGDEVPPRPQAA